MTHGSLFSGIEGFGIAAHWMGWENKFHCEWNPFGRHINHYYWPQAASYNDVTKTDFTIWRGRIDVLTGGFPCQPFSTAGKRKGTDDARYLWPEMLRVIREVRPRWVIGENVYGLVNWDGGLVFDTVCADLENEGFEVWPVVLPAAGVNAPHRRDRIWFIAHNTGQRLETQSIHGIKQGYERPERCYTPSAYTNPHNGSFGKELGQLQEESGEIPQRDDNAESCNAGDGSSQNPLKDGRPCDQRQGEPGTREQRDTGTGDNEQLCANNDEAGINSDPSSCGMEGGWPDRQQESSIPSGSGLSGCYGSAHHWSNWPTVPPVCNGDDGFSAILDADTISEVAGKRVRNAYTWWRTESIKAGGNAIVPEVALQLLKTIEAFEAMMVK